MVLKICLEFNSKHQNIFKCRLINFKIMLVILWNVIMNMILVKKCLNSIWLFLYYYFIKYISFGLIIRIHRLVIVYTNIRLMEFTVFILIMLFRYIHYSQLPLSIEHKQCCIWYYDFTLFSRGVLCCYVQFLPRCLDFIHPKCSFWPVDCWYRIYFNVFVS